MNLTDEGLLWSCERCGGSFFNRDQWLAYFGIERAEEVEPNEAHHLTRASASIACPNCLHSMEQVEVEGVRLDLCGRGCGLFADGGEILALRGRLIGKHGVGVVRLIERLLVMPGSQGPYR